LTEGAIEGVGATKTELAVVAIPVTEVVCLFSIPFASTNDANNAKNDNKNSIPN